MIKSVLLDTNFFIGLFKPGYELHPSIREYYKYFLNEEIPMKVSTISVAEYCVKGKIEELPLDKLKIVGFNVMHSPKAGEFAKIVYGAKLNPKIDPRHVIPNDTKLFAQADIDTQVSHFVTSDKRTQRMLNTLKQTTNVNFEIIDLNVPIHEVLGMIPF